MHIIGFTIPTSMGTGILDRSYKSDGVVRSYALHYLVNIRSILCGLVRPTRLRSKSSSSRSLEWRLVNFPHKYFGQAHMNKMCFCSGALATISKGFDKIRYDPGIV